MSTSSYPDYRYQVGGSLPESASTYVMRQADSVFYQKLKEGTYCYVLNSRQMGKSSLRVQTMKTLKMEGFACASIEMRDICSHEVTKDEFYGGFIHLLVSGFNLVIDVEDWWSKHQRIPPSQRLGEFIEKVLLREISKRIIIFVDEIDSFLSLEFRDDFFAFIRSCYNRRADNEKYRRLTFALLGVATPTDLIQDVIRSPLNIESQAIELTGFEINQTMPLQKGLEGKVSNPEAIMTSVLKWTGGQPFLTQRLCKLILENSPIPANQEAQFVDKIVQQQIIYNWQVRDEQQHLKTIQDRILKRKDKTSCLLKLYKKILDQGEIEADDTGEEIELRLSGLVVKREGKLKVYNLLYKSIFNQNWINKVLMLEDDGGNDEPVSPEDSASLFELHNDMLANVNRNIRGVGVFSSRQDVESALHELRDSGFPLDKVYVISQNSDSTDDITGAEERERIGDKANGGATVGAFSGGTLGGLTGLLVGLGTLAIPGIGPILLVGAAATAVATTLAGASIGALAGSLAGGLIGLGIPKEQARAYNERVKRKHYLIVIDGTRAEITRAQAILESQGVEEFGIYDQR